MILLIVGAGTERSPGVTPTSHDAPPPLPALTAKITMPTRMTVPGRAPALAWPATGEGAVEVRGIGLMGASGHQRSVPIASLTKMMTAYVILRDHPLAPGESGPSLTMTAADVAAWFHASQTGLSNVTVAVGEVLTERQLLEALLIPSADNIADRLARWDAGSIPAFVAKMNAEARVLGLAGAHYADASGVNPGSRGTAADEARLGALLMGSAVVRSIVRLPSAPFPVAGQVWNYNPGLGVDGIIGVKSGFTSQAQACLVTAAFRTVAGHSVLVVAASLGQPGGLAGAAQSDEALLTSATSALLAYPVTAPRAAVGSVRPGWSPTAVRLLAPALRATVAAWPGLRLSRSVVVASQPPAAEPAGSVVGALAIGASQGTIASVPLRLAARLPAVPAGWTPAAG